MDTPRESRSTAFDNPWHSMLWALTALALLAGIIMVADTPDPTAIGYDPVEAANTAALGRLLLGVGGVFLLGTLVSGAICWQLRRR